MDKQLKKYLEEVEKKFGEGSVMFGNEARQKPDVISTGSLKLDLATGVGGFPRGAVVELKGWQSSGKSTIALNVIANAQKRGVKCLLVDGENSFDAKYAKALGVNIDELLIRQLDQDGAETCYNIAELLIKSGSIGVVVFDSQTSLITKKQIEDPVGTASMALQARLMSSSLPKFVTLAAQHNCLIIYITQLREKPGVMYGSPVTGTGGNALKFYAHMVVDVSKKVLAEKGSDVKVLNRTTCIVSKNKLSVPYKEAEFDVVFGKGIDTIAELAEVASEMGIIDVKGSWYYYNGSRLGQGIGTVSEMLTNNPDLYEEIRGLVLKGTSEKKEETIQ